jgi:hypothetical protein
MDLALALVYLENCFLMHQVESMYWQYGSWKKNYKGVIAKGTVRK